MAVESGAHARRAMVSISMRKTLHDDFGATQQQMIVYAIVGLISLSLLSSAAWFAFSLGDDSDGIDDPMANWVDPVTEVEDDNHSHNNLFDHRLQTSNMKLIDYHNLNCDGNEKPPAELDNVAGRPCYPEYKNTGPTPGDNSEIAIEGNFRDDCEIYAYGTGGCFAYVSSYNQFEILDVSKQHHFAFDILC